MALDTLSNVKIRLGISGSSDDTLLGKLQDSADAFIANFCDRDFTGGTFTASTCGRASWDTILAQHSAGRATERVCADDTCGGTSRQSSLTSTIPAGPGLHALYVDGFSGAGGIYSFQYTRP